MMKGYFSSKSFMSIRFERDTSSILPMPERLRVTTRARRSSPSISIRNETPSRSSYFCPSGYTSNTMPPLVAAENLHAMEISGPRR